MQDERLFILDELNSVLIVVFVLFSMVLTLAYAALNNMRPAHVRELSENGNKTAIRALVLINSKSKLIITYQLCMALSQTIITVLLVHALYEPIIREAGLGAALLVGVFIGIVLLIVVQIAPEGVGSVYAKALYPLLTPILDWVVWLLTPITMLLILASKGLAGMFGGSALVNTVTEEEVLTLVNSGDFEENEKDMIYSVLQLDQRDARQLMVPRMDVVAVESNETLETAADLFTNSGFSRMPVYNGTIDHISGVLYAKDLIPFWRRGKQRGKLVKDLMRNAYFVPETLAADELLQTMQKRNGHMAIVVDEYGGTSGLITIENLIEEIVGDIRDEYDQNEEIEYTEISENEYSLAGSMNIAHINELLDLDIEEGTDYDTIGGYLYMKLGRVPHLGDKVEEDDFDVIVNSIEGRRIRKVNIIRKNTAAVPVTTQTTPVVALTEDPDPIVDTSASPTLPVRPLTLASESP